MMVSVILKKGALLKYGWNRWQLWSASRSLMGANGYRYRGNKMALLITVEARLTGKLRHILSTLVCNWNFLLRKKNPTLVHSPQKSTSALHSFEFMNDCASFCSHLNESLMAQSYTSICTVSVSTSQHFLYFPQPLSIHILLLQF